MTRYEVLHLMGETRRLAKLGGPSKAEARMLEIAEVAYVLHADGFPEPEVFERLAQVYGTPPPPEPLDDLEKYLAEHLQALDPAYLDLATRCGVFGVVLQVACLWAELNAGQVIRCGWPHQDQLRTAWEIDAYTGIIRTIPKEGGRRKMKPFPKFTRSLADIDILLTEYRGEGAADVRRWKARAVPGDVLHGFSTGSRSFRMMGSSGIALVRGGRAIDYIVTMRN